MIIFFLSLLGFYVDYMSETLVNGKLPFTDIIGCLMGFILFITLPFIIIQNFIKHRYTILMSDTSIIIKDVILRREQTYLKKEIKGFELSKYPTKLWTYKMIVLHFKDENKIELPQFLYLNFSSIHNALDTFGLKIIKS
jgi:hypothetical protein